MKICYCGSSEVRLYAAGYRCNDHTPAKLAGNPEPDSKRYCAPLRCTCGGCPSYTPDTAHHVGATVLDIRAVASGKRRSGQADYRSAQLNTRGGAA